MCKIWLHVHSKIPFAAHLTAQLSGMALNYWLILGWNPAATSWYGNIPAFTGFYTSQVVVWDFSHQQYHKLLNILSCLKTGPAHTMLAPSMLRPSVIWTSLTKTIKEKPLFLHVFFCECYYMELLLWSSCIIISTYFLKTPLKLRQAPEGFTTLRLWKPKIPSKSNTLRLGPLSCPKRVQGDFFSKTGGDLPFSPPPPFFKGGEKVGKFLPSLPNPLDFE